MAADLNLLVLDMREKVSRLLTRCVARGIQMRPNCGLRNPFDQARLWRQSRSIEEIMSKINELESQGAPFLADCIRRVGPQHGAYATGTPPGFSWHQWGEALDCFWVVNGAAEWSTQRKVNGLNGYHVYAEEAEKIGLTAGGHWSNFEDWPHIQLRQADNAASVLSLQEIDAEMLKRYGS
jgi:peptidoglycan LD-endopeptidase CwlK